MLDQLPKIVARRKKRIGRGWGSGKGGHTVGRGQKGQKVRGKIYPLFEGTKVKKSLIQRLPLQRGKGKFKARRTKPLIVNLKYLDLLPEGSVVDVQLLMKAGIVNKDADKVKILGEGNITKRLTVKLPMSASAAEKIRQAGGKIENT